MTNQRLLELAKKSRPLQEWFDEDMRGLYEGSESMAEPTARETMEANANGSYPKTIMLDFAIRIAEASERAARNAGLEEARQAVIDLASDYRERGLVAEAHGVEVAEEAIRALKT